MTITSAQFPQADDLGAVGQVATAVRKGNKTDAEIERFIGLNSKGRQGRYYRRAAQILGLIRNERNHAVLTPLGREYTTLATSKAKRDFLAHCLIETPVFKQALRYIYANRPTDPQLRTWFHKMYPGSAQTADRRFRTFSKYIADADLISLTGEAYRVRRFEGAIVRVSARTGRLAGKGKSGAASLATSSTIRYEVDAQKLERANHIHWQLVAGKGAFLEANQWPAMDNELIDLYSQADDEAVIYEMKSTSVGGGNVQAQIRKAVAQLYEYRYVFGLAKAKLCIVTDAELAKDNRWVANYLASDRGIAYEWTSDMKTFQSLPSSKQLLGKFAPT